MFYVNMYVLKFVVGKCKKPQHIGKIPNWSDYVLEEGMVFSNGKLCIVENVLKQAHRRMLIFCNDVGFHVTGTYNK